MINLNTGKLPWSSGKVSNGQMCQLLLLSVLVHFFVSCDSCFSVCSVLHCILPLCFSNLTPTLCFHCFLLSFLCSFSPCLPPRPPPPTPTPCLSLSLSLAPTPLSASAVLSCAVCLVLQGQDRAVLTGTSPEQCETEGGRHRNWVKEGERVRFVLTRADWIAENNWTLFFPL